MKRLKKIIAFSLAETLIMLSVIGVFMIFVAKSASKVSLNQDLAKFKKAYSEIETTISKLMNDELIYGTTSGFLDTESITLEHIGEIIGQNGVSKFRDAFKYSIHYVEDKIDCEIYEGYSPDGCFQTNYGVVFGIPDTDFVKKGVIETLDANNNKITAVPITFYTNYRPGQTVKDNAFVAVVTYDGAIYFKNTKDANCSSNSKQMQCNLKQFIQATTVKRQSSSEKVKNEEVN